MSRCSAFSILPVQILHRPSEYFIFWSRLSVLSWPWNNFQLKSLHFLGMNLLLKFCVNHMFQLILLSCSLCSQYDLEAITGFLFTTNTLYISFSDRSLSAFRPTPGTSNNVSSKFSGVVFSFFCDVLFFQELGNAALTLWISKKKLALCSNFWYIPYSSSSPFFMMSLMWVIPTFDQCLKYNGVPLNLKALFPQMISFSSSLITIDFLHNSWKNMMHFL